MKRGHLLASLLVLSFCNTASAALENYWPVNETSGNETANAVSGGIAGTLFGGATFFTDPLRGQVVAFDGAPGSYVNAGLQTIPQMTLENDFTWSFWSHHIGGGLNTIILGNRYSSTSNTEFSPREFIKFTPSQFEFHRNATAENLDYVDHAAGVWTHNVVVKSGNRLTYYRDGRFANTRLITQGTNNAQPLFWGGNGNLENWTGRIDDVALWTDKLPSSSAFQLARGMNSPLTVRTSDAALATVMSDTFSTNLNQWTATNRGLENNAFAGYDEPTISGGQVTLGGTATNQFWYGSSLESNTFFDSSLETVVSVDRISLTGTGTYRSSLWILGDNGHYLHFAQNIGEDGWTWNARDDGGLGTLSPTGRGNNIAGLNSLDTDGGLHKMSIRLTPGQVAGEMLMSMSLDGDVYADHLFTNFPSTFQVVLTGQARATGDSVSAVFDNLEVQQIPEPTAAALLLAGGVLALRRRRS